MWLDEVMTTTTAHPTMTDEPFIQVQVGKTGRYCAPGVNKQDGLLEIHICRDCGREMVLATSNRTGNKYRANVIRSLTTGAMFYLKSQPHKCDPADIESFQQYVAAKEVIAADLGEITVGCRARVVKGRKHPIGTEGDVFWIAYTADQWGVVKVGMMTDAGEKVWINKDNIERQEVK